MGQSWGYSHPFFLLYFLTVVDDFTRETWVHLLKNKFDSFLTIKICCVYERNHFDKNIKFIRSDNAFEFKDQEPLVEKT